jgi:hypothetical protein
MRTRRLGLRPRFKNATSILIEHQPPEGLTTIEECFFVLFRDKAKKVYPRTLKASFGFTGTYNERKEQASKRGRDLLDQYSSDPLLVERYDALERKHDRGSAEASIGEAICYIMLYTGYVKREPIPKSRKVCATSDVSQVSEQTTVICTTNEDTKMCVQNVQAPKPLVICAISNDDKACAIQELLTIEGSPEAQVGWNSIWDQKEIDPPEQAWKDLDEGRKKFILQTLRIEKARRIKNPITPVRWVLNRYLGLDLSNKQKTKRKSHPPVRRTMYRIKPESQKELFNLIRTNKASTLQMLYEPSVPKEWDIQGSVLCLKRDNKPHFFQIFLFLSNFVFCTDRVFQ